MVLDKPLEALDRQDVLALMENQVPEGKTIEYKESLPGNSYDDRKEFLADVSSFANASGGHLIYGIAEAEGLPVDIPGLSNIDPDAEKLRLENLLRDCIEPRIPGVGIHPIQLKSSDMVIVIRIPLNWAQPHAVVFKKHWRFYSRNSAGKYPLDVSELRAAFLLSETAAEAIRSFRIERLTRIVAGETPVNLAENAKIVLHLVPLANSGHAAQLDLRSMQDQQRTLPPIVGSRWNARFNLDGFLTYTTADNDGFVDEYVQVFRNGSIEAVDAHLLSHTIPEERLPFIPSSAYEREVLAVLPKYVDVQRRLRVSPPVFIMLSMLGVSGYVLAVGTYRYYEDAHRIEGRDLILPEILVEDFDPEWDQVMRPAFDAVWNAAGWPECKNYNENGKWVERR